MYDALVLVMDKHSTSGLRCVSFRTWVKLAAVGRVDYLPLAIPQAMLDYVGTPGKSYRGAAARFSVELRVDYLLPSGRQIRRRLRLTTAVPSQKELYEHAERLAMAGYG
jgi:hypothetical protein